MQAADYWRLCSHLSLFQAIMLTLGYDPENQNSYDIQNHNKCPIPQGYGALKTAIVNALVAGQIEGSVAEQTFDGRGNELYAPCVDIDDSTICVQSLKAFLKERGFSEGFFFPEGNISEQYFDSQSIYYAPKLAAAVNAWKTITENSELLNGKTPKQAMQKWLRENANKYGLTKDDGSPNETGIEEICKVANWQTGGGAARTPVTPPLVNDSSPPTGKPQKLKVFGVSQDLPFSVDDEIPF